MAEPARLLPASALQSGSRMVSLGLQAVHFALVARLLDPSEFAAYVPALALFGIFGALADFGLIQTTVLELNRRPREEGRLVVAALSASAVLSLVSVAAGAAITLTVLPDEAQVAAMLLVPAFLVVRAQLPFMALRQHRLQFKRVATAETTGRVVAAAALGISFVALPHPGTQAGFAAAAGTVLLGGLVTLTLVVARPDPTGARRDHRHEAAGLLRRAVPLGLTNAASFVHFRVDQVLLAALGVTVGLAEYAIAYRGLEAALGLVAAIGVVALPLLVRAVGPARAHVARELEDMLAGLAMVLGMLVFAFAPLATSLLGGGQYGEAAWYLRLLAPAVVMSVMNLGYSHVAIVQGRARALLLISGVSVVANVGLNLVLIPRLGVLGAVVSTLSTELMGGLLVAGVASQSLAGSVRLGRAAFAFAGFLVACFGGLAAWSEWSPLTGVVVAAVGASMCVAPLIRGLQQLLDPRLDHPAAGDPVLVTDRGVIAP